MQFFDLGCGPAAIPLRLAKLFRHCQIHCVDGAAQMLIQGKQAVQRGRTGGASTFFPRQSARQASTPTRPIRDGYFQ